MKNLIALIGLIAAPQLAHAQDHPDIVDACATALEFQIGQEFEVRNVQAFPELDPPRVRFEAYAEGGDTLTNALAALIASETGDDTSTSEPRQIASARCEFENSVSPFGLTAFSCSGRSCDELLLDDGDRLEELQVLMQREGY